MKMLLTGDLHIRSSNPENRIDMFFQTQLNKFEQILILADDNDCKYILCPGDVFDNPRPSFEVLEYYIMLFNKYKVGNEKEIKFLTVWGQHDCYFRQHNKTALKLMESLGYIKTIDKLEIVDDDLIINLYGSNYGDDIPTPDTEGYNFLLIHETILSKSQWKGHENFIQPEKIFKQYDYDLVISGDWHRPIYFEKSGKTILNCGCLVRKTTSEADLKPHIYILDVDKDLGYTLNKVELDFEPAENVFKKEALSKEVSESNKKMQEFIENIQINTLSKNLDFKKNLDEILLKTESEVKDLILKEIENYEVENAV